MYRVSPNALYLLGWQIESIVIRYNYIRKHGRKAMHDVVREFTRLLCVFSSFQMRNMNSNMNAKAELTFHPLHLRLSQRSGHTAARLYGERYPTKRQPSQPGCFRIWKNVDPSEPRLKVLGGRIQHEHPYSKKVCCMLWIKISVRVDGRLHVHPGSLKKLSIVHCRGKPYIRFVFKECKYYSQIIIHDLLLLHSALLTKVRQACTLQVSCCSAMKQPFHVKGCCIQCAHVSIKQPIRHPTTSSTTNFHC